MYKNKTKATWQTEINAYTFENQTFEVLKRIYPNSQFEYSNIENLTGETLYDAISPFQMAGESKIYDTKLPWQDVLNEVDDYKSDMLAMIDRVFIVIDIQDHWLEALTGASVLGSTTSYSNLMEQAETTDILSELNSAKTEFDAIVIRKTRDENIATKMKRINEGNKVIALINYLNESNNVTPTQMATIFANADVINIMNALSTGSLNTAKTLIQAIDLTGLDPMDASYKTECIELIDEFLGV
jgi:hypothetical protein